MISQRWNPFLRFPGVSLLATAILLIPILLQLTQFRVSSESRVLLEGDQRNLSSYDKVTDILGNETVLVVSMECSEVFTPRNIEALRRLSDTFQGQPGVTDVKSLTHSVKPVRKGLGFDMVPLVPVDASEAKLDEIRQFCLRHPLTRNVMVGPESRHTILLVTYRRELDSPVQQTEWRREIESVLEPFREAGFQFHTLALPLIEEEIRSTLRSDLTWFLPATIGLLALILWVTFRSKLLLGLVLVNQAAVLFTMPGLFDLLGYRINVFSVMLFPLVAGIHLTLLAHLYTAFQRGRRQGLNGYGAMDHMLRSVFKSCAFALLTTAIGLFSLTVSDVAQVREFGMLGAIGIGLVFVATFGPGLALLKLICGRPESSTASAEAVGDNPDDMPFTGSDHKVVAGQNRVQGTADRSSAPPEGLPRPKAVSSNESSFDWADWVTRTVRARRVWILMGAGAALALIGLGMGRIRTDIRAVEFLGDQSPTRQAVEELDRVYGGINVVQIELDSGQTNGINQVPFLNYVQKVHDYTQGKEPVTGVYSYSQLMGMMNQIWEREQPGSFQVPASPLKITLFTQALKMRDYPFLTALADAEFRTAYLVLRTRDMPSDRYLNLLHDVVDYARQVKPEGAAVSAAKGIHSILEANRRIVRSQVNTVGFTAAVIVLVLAVLWRSLRLALLSLLTNAIPVALVIAAAGFADIPLNSITLMVGAVALGIAVDDSVHFLTYWRDRRRAGISGRESILQTFRVKGRPIFFTSLILVGTFSMFAFSSFPPVAHFGGLSALAFLGALVAVLFFLPAILMFRARSGND